MVITDAVQLKATLSWLLSIDMLSSHQQTADHHPRSDSEKRIVCGKNSCWSMILNGNFSISTSVFIYCYSFFTAPTIFHCISNFISSYTHFTRNLIHLFCRFFQLSKCCFPRMNNYKRKTLERTTKATHFHAGVNGGQRKIERKREKIV